MLGFIYKLLGICQHDFKLIKVHSVKNISKNNIYITEYYFCRKCKKIKVKKEKL